MPQKPAATNPKNVAISISLKSFPQFLLPLKPIMDVNTSHPGDTTLDAAAAITLFTIRQPHHENNSKFSIKPEAQLRPLKVRTISEDLDEGGESSSETDPDLDQDSSDVGAGEEDDAKHGESVENVNRFDFLLRLFVNLGYLICLVPFRLYPVSVGHRVYFEIYHHPVQRAVCMIQSCTATIVCFLVAYAQIGGQNIENNPLVIFNFWSYSVFCWWCFLFIHIFWWKEHLILAIVNKEEEPPQQQLLDKSKNAALPDPLRADAPFPGSFDEWFATLYFFGIVLEEIYHKTVFYLFPTTYLPLSRAAEVYSGKAMYSLFLRNSTDPIPFKDISSTTFGISLWHFYGWQIFGAIKSLVYIFVTFSSLFLAGRIKRQLKAVRKVKVSTDHHHHHHHPHNHGGACCVLASKQIWSHFTKIRTTLGQINELTNLCVLGIYLILVPFLSSSFIQRWDSDFIEYKILMVLQFVWPMIALVTASEASRLGEKFLRVVKDRSEGVHRSQNYDDGKHHSAYFVYENANFFMKGGKFFNVSYGFMGATLSVVMTYGLVILGFLHDSHGKARKC